MEKPAKIFVGGYCPTSTTPTSTVVPVWDHWTSEVVVRSVPVGTRRVSTRRVSTRYRPGRVVRVLPGNPSLPLRVLLRGLERVRNGGLNGTDLGIDLSLRWGEVRKLFYAGRFTGVLVREGIDPEDFLQEVYRGLLARNNGTCPWDAKKSSFGHYVHIVIRCVLANYLRRERRYSQECVMDERELTRYTGDDMENPAELPHLLSRVFQSLPDGERTAAREFTSHLYAGIPRRKALSLVGKDEAWGGKILAVVRQTLRT